MARLNPDATPTQRQGAVLTALSPVNHRTTRDMGVRSDVLWRMQEAGWVARTTRLKRPDDEWRITFAGRVALERWQIGEVRPEQRQPSTPGPGLVQVRLMGSQVDMTDLVGMLRAAGFDCSEPSRPQPNRRDPGHRVHFAIQLPPLGRR